MTLSTSWSHVLLGCAVLCFLQSYVIAMECTDMEEQEECHRSCQEKGYRYGTCEYSDCVCYGITRRPNGGSLMLGNGPAVGRQFARPRLAFLQNRVQPTPSATTKKPLKCTSAVKTSRKELSSYETCAEWCQETLYEVYASYDNLCCCEKK